MQPNTRLQAQVASTCSVTTGCARKKKKVTSGAQKTLSPALYLNVCSLTEHSTQQCQPGTRALCTPQLFFPRSPSIRRRASRRALLQSLAASNGRLEISLCVTHLSESLAFCCGALLHRVRLSMRASSPRLLLSVSMQGGGGRWDGGVQGVQDKTEGRRLRFFFLFFLTF